MITVSGVMVEIEIVENNMCYIINTFSSYYSILHWYHPQRCQKCIKKVIECFKPSTLLRH